MSVYFIGDTHFHHYNILRYCSRPFENVNEMDDALVYNWNSVITDRDFVYHLGDVGFGDMSDILPKLRGRKILILGSHDKDVKRPEAAKHFEQIHHGFFELKMDGQLVVLCHYCMQSWPKSFHGSWHLYGHSHGRIEEAETMLRFDVGVDVWDFKPVPWDIVKRKMSLKKRCDHYDIQESDRFVLENAKSNRAFLFNEA